MEGKLVLQDGTVYEGTLIGKKSNSFGELVFTTAMVGYQESLTDPSYAGQIVTFSNPLIGNYGIDRISESDTIHAAGTVISNLYERSALPNILKKAGKTGIVGVDTRAMVRKIAMNGTMLAVITNDDKNRAMELIYSHPDPNTQDLVKLVSVTKVVNIFNNKSKNYGIIDLGVKNGIIKELSKFGNITLFPYNTDFNTLKSANIDALVISNGPGDPAHESLEQVKHLLLKVKEQYPIFGICLGHQILAQLFGAKTYKMKFGHRGINHPVKYGGRVYITTHNHGFAVLEESVPAEMEVTQYDINDGTVEGLKHRELPIMSTQYHPEARPGPGDTAFIFSEFDRMVNVER